jgi:hypothetical protein
VTCYTQPCKPCKVKYVLDYLPQGGESSPRGIWGICAPALPDVLTNDACQQYGFHSDGRRASVLFGDLVELLVSTSHDYPFDLSVPFLLKKHMRLKHGLSMDLAQFSTVLWIERVTKMQFLQFRLIRCECFVTPFLQTGLE